MLRAPSVSIMVDTYPCGNCLDGRMTAVITSGIGFFMTLSTSPSCLLSVPLPLRHEAVSCNKVRYGYSRFRLTSLKAMLSAWMERFRLILPAIPS